MQHSRKLLITLLCAAPAFSSMAAVNDTITGNISGVSNQVNRDIGDVPGNRYFGDLNFDYHNDSPGEIDRRFTFGARVNDENLTMYSLQEAYVGKKGLFKAWDPIDNSGDQVRFGRQILPWSMADKMWGFGKLNNRRNFDFFEPGEEGLIGLTYENKSSSGFKWAIFGSAIFVPEMNPSLDIDKKNKTITSRHPYADAPASTVEIDGKTTPIRYDVDYPEVSEVIYRQSIGANLGYEKKHWAGNLFFMRKPENQLSTKVRVGLNSKDPNDVHVNAYITPQFYYHDVFGGNVSWKNKDVEIYATAIGIHPNTFPDGDNRATLFTEIKTEKKREAYAGGGISKSNDRYAMGFNYIARLSPFDRERDSLATDPRWNQAFNVFLMRNFWRKYNLSGDLKYDTLTTDRLLMVRAGYNVSKALLMHLGVNMIGTPADGKSFWSPYTNNDAVYAGLRYIF